MVKQMFKVPEKFRIKTGRQRSTKADGNNGAFLIRSLKLKRSLTVIASDGMGWEHVSVSLHNRCPTWTEMCVVKELFWGEDDLVVQFHQREKDYVNNHAYCLHMWRKAGMNDYCEMPPKIMV
jgi:hypothetical protein